MVAIAFLTLAYLLLIVAFLLMCQSHAELEKRVKLLEEGEE